MCHPCRGLSIFRVSVPEVPLRSTSGYRMPLLRSSYQQRFRLSGSPPPELLPTPIPTIRFSSFESLTSNDTNNNVASSGALTNSDSDYPVISSGTLTSNDTNNNVASSGAFTNIDSGSLLIYYQFFIPRVIRIRLTNSWDPKVSESFNALSEA